MSAASSPVASARGLVADVARRTAQHMSGPVKAPKRAALTRLELPVDLAAWLARVPVREAAQVLVVSEGRVRQLKCGAGAGASPAILRRWAEHQSAAGLPVGGWHIRRVQTGGVVWLAGVEYGAPALAVFVGRQVNVARLHSGALRVLPLAIAGGFDAQALQVQP